MNEQDTILKKKADEFLKNQNYIHIKLNNGRFLNGTIIEMRSDFFIFVDRMLGEMPVFFLEIENIEPFKTEKKEGEDDTRK